MKKILATLFCVSLLGMPLLANTGDDAGKSCCAQKQTAQKQQCSSKKTSEMSQKKAGGDCCAQEGKQSAKKADKAPTATQSTWMMEASSECKNCKASS